MVLPDLGRSESVLFGNLQNLGRSSFTRRVLSKAAWHIFKHSREHLTAPDVPHIGISMLAVTIVLM